MLDKVLALVAPHECAGCGQEGAVLCGDCSSSLSPAVSRCYRCHKSSENWRTCAVCRRKSKLFAVYAATKYEGPAEEMVQRLKFGHAVAAAGVIAGQLAALVPHDKDLIISYLPTATSRVRQRGFDQARLIAKKLAIVSDLPFNVFLIRIGQGRQVGAGRSERYRQAGDMFRVCNRVLLTGATVVLIDDVVTTGASLEAAATELRAAGARRVYGLVFCQA